MKCFKRTKPQPPATETPWAFRRKNWYSSTDLSPYVLRKEDGSSYIAISGVVYSLDNLTASPDVWEPVHSDEELVLTNE